MPAPSEIDRLRLERDLFLRLLELGARDDLRPFLEDALALMWVDITDRLLVHIPMPAMPPQDNPGSSGGEQPPNQQRRVQTW